MSTFGCSFHGTVKIMRNHANSTACKLVCSNSRPSQLAELWPPYPVCHSGLLRRLCVMSTTFCSKFGNTTNCSSSRDNIFYVYDGLLFFLYLKKSATDLTKCFLWWWANPQQFSTTQCKSLFKTKLEEAKNKNRRGISSFHFAFSHQTTRQPYILDMWPP